MKINKYIKKSINTILIIIMTISLGICFQDLCTKGYTNNIFWNQRYLFNSTSSDYKTNNLHYLAKIDHVKSIPNSNSLHWSDIKQRIHFYGIWNALGMLLPKRYYIMSFHYYSQLYPVYAPDACEAVSLRMALSAKGVNIPVSMKTFINRIPRSKNPNYGYTSDPYKYGDSATINPRGLIRYARKYDAHIKDLTDSSKDTFIKEIKHGNPVVFEGAYQMKEPTSDHVLLLIGYRSGHPGQFLVADPFQRKAQHNKVFWISTTDFMKIYHKSFRDEHALAVLGKIKYKRTNHHHKHQHKHIKYYKHSFTTTFQASRLYTQPNLTTTNEYSSHNITKLHKSITPHRIYNAMNNIPVRKSVPYYHLQNSFNNYQYTNRITGITNQQAYNNYQQSANYQK